MSNLWYNYGNHMTTPSMEQTLIATYGDEIAGKSSDELVQMAISYFFDFEFPFYSELQSDLDTFKELFVRKYYQYAFGTETVGQFKFYLKEKLMELQPKYKYLYDTTTYSFNPLINHLLVRESEYSNRNNSTSSGNNSSTSTRTPNLKYQDDDLNQTLNTDMPSYNFSAANYASDMQQNQALNTRTETGTDKNITTSNGSQSMSGGGSGSDKSKEYGFNGSQSEELAKYRSLLLNINQLLLEDLASLFMLMEV